MMMINSLYYNCAQRMCTIEKSLYMHKETENLVRSFKDRGYDDS